MTNAIGLDVAKWQIGFNPDLATGAVDFAFEKVSDGIAVHSAFETMWAGVAKVPIRGGYHYQRSGVGWQAQADTFLQAAGTKDFHIYALDVEGANNVVDDNFLLSSRNIIDYWRSKTSKRVILYTNLDYYKQLRAALGASADAWLNSTALWFAYPNGNPGIVPVIPGRTNWSIHQYSWTGKPERWGTQAVTDENVFNGTIADMKQWAGVTTTPPPIGVTMKYTATATANDTRLRPDHNVNLTYIGTYPLGTKFNGDVLFIAAPPLVANQLAGDKWLEVKEIIMPDGTKIVKAGWVAIIHMAKPICSLVENVVTPPSTLPPVDVTVNITAQGYRPLTLTGTQMPL